MIYLEIRRKGEPSLVPLVERWVDYEDDGKNLLAHMDDHTLYSNDPKNEKTHKKVNGVDYHYTFSASIPVRMRDSNDRKNKKGDLLVNTSDIAVYVARAEELADDKASSLAGSFISTKNGYFVKYKVLISSPPSYEVVVYERDENTSEPIIHSYWWTDRDGLQSGPLKWQGFPLPKSEVSARENSLKIKDYGKVYYKEYEVCEPEESKDRKIEEKTKEFDYWSKARKFYLENKWVYKAERLHYGDVEETLERGVEATIKDPMDDAEYWVDLITQKSNALLSSGDLAGLKVDELKSIYETYKALMSIAKRELKDSDIWELMKNNRARKLLVGMSHAGRKSFLDEYIGFLQDIKDKNATIDDVVDLIEDDIRSRRLPESLDLLEAGYDGYSMSNNARVAYENDEKPLSKWSKEDILYCAGRINKYKAMMLKKVSLEDLRNHLLTRTSWHHTSSYYNQTDFYSFDEEAYENVHESDINRWVEVHKQDMADKRKEAPRVRKGRIDYLVWSGSRAHPRASEEHLDNVNIEERGSFYVITDDSGKEILRKKIGSNWTHVKFYESIDRIDGDLGILAFDNAKEAAYYIRKNASKYLRVSAFEGSAIGGGNVYLVGNMMDVNHGEMVRAAVANGYISKDCSDKGYYDCYAFPSKELDDNYNLYLLLGDFSTYVQFVYDGFLLYCVDDYGDGESFKGTELVKALGSAKSIDKVGLDDECNAVLPYYQIEHDVINKAIGFLKEGKPLNEAYDHMHPRYLNGWYETEIEEMLDDNLMHSQHPIETNIGESLIFTEAKREVPKADEFDYPIYQDFLYLVHGRKYKAIPSDKIGKIDNLMDGFLKARDEQIALSRQLDKYNLDPNKSRLFFYDHEDELSPDALKLYHDEHDAYIKELNILQELSDLVDSTYESLNFTSIDSCNAIEVFSKCIRGKSDDEILKMANISAKHDAAADYGAMFCFPNGAVISTKKTHNDLMMSLLKGVLRHSYGDALDIDVSTSVVANLVNYMLDERGWARFNSGTRHETRRYCVLPDSMTSEQYQRLHEFLVFGESSSAEAIQVFVGRDEAYHSFDLRYSNADEILRSIKMFYSRGWFSESFSNTKRNLEDNIMNSQNQIEEGCNMSKRRVREDWSYIPLDVMDMKRHGVFDSFVDLFMHDGEKSWQIRIKKAFENAGLKVSLQGEGNKGEVWYVYDGGIILSEFRCQGNYLTATTNMKHNQNSVWKYIAGINGRFSRDGLKSNINLESSNWECFAQDLGNYIYRYNQHLQREVDFRKEYVGKTLVAQKSRDDSTPIDVVIEDSMIGFDYGSGDYNRPCFYISTHSLSTSPYFVVKLKRTKETALTCSIRKEEDTSKWVYQPNYKNVEIENPFDQAFIGLKYEEPKPKGHREFTLDSLLTGMKKRGIIDKNTPSSGPVYIPEENIDDFKKAYEERFECARGIPLNVFTELSRILHPETWKLFCRKGLWPRYFKHHTSIDIYVPNGVDSIPPYGFEPSFSTYDDVRSGRYSLTLNIKNIPSSVTSIGDFAFMDNRMGEFPEIPSSVTSIGRGAFKRCHNMKSLTIPDSVTSIGEDAFKECGVNTKGGLIIKTKSERVAKLCREAGCNNVEIVESLRESLSLLNETPEKHDTLNPKIWDIESNTLKPEVKEKIMEIVDDFCKGLEDDEIKFNLKDVRLVGSNCSYNYNDKSDLDIHLIMDTKSLKCPDNLYPLLYSSYRSLWNKGHDIDFYGIPVEIFVETDDTLDMNESLREHVSNDDVRWLRNWMELDREPYLKSFDEANCKAHYAFNGTSKMSVEDFLKYGEYDKFIENLEAKGFHIDVYKADYSYKTVGTYTVAHGRRGANRDRTLKGLIQFDITW